MTFLRRTVIAAAAAVAFSASFTALAQDIKPRLIRFGYGLNEQSNQGRAAKVFAEAVEKASGGKMKVRAIGAAALGPDTQMQQALIGGAQEMMVGSIATLVSITKEMALGTRLSCSTTRRKPMRCRTGHWGTESEPSWKKKG